MQSPDPEKPNSSDDSDKSFSEWPTLDDISKTTKKSMNGVGSIKKQNGDKAIKSPPENQNGHECSEVNKNPSPGPSGHGARKKNANKTKWVPVPIYHEPYRRRGNGRPIYDSNRINGEKKNESIENGYAHDGARNGARGNNRSRGKRGRGYFHNFRQRREESDTPTNENEKLKYANGCYYNPALYDPFAHEIYVTSTTKAKDELKDAIRKQIEYYFSEGNLLRDSFLRQKMDSQGYVPISLIATFNRVKNLTRNLTRKLDCVVEALIDSSKLELLDNAKVRPVVDPLKWPIEAETSRLRTDVPEFFPGKPYVHNVVNGFHNLSFNNDVNGESLPQSPQDSLSPDQANDYLDNPIVNEIYYQSSPDCSHTPSPPEHVNGFECYSGEISNGVCIFTANAREAISNAVNYYFVNTTSDHCDDQQDTLDSKSPEPTR